MAIVPAKMADSRPANTTRSCAAWRTPTMSTPSEVKKALMAVMPLFANYKPPQTDAEIHALEAAWHRQVGHLDVAILNAALADAAGKTGFFPTPKEVLDSVVTLS